jgi:hypothetical protein
MSAFEAIKEISRLTNIRKSASSPNRAI